METVKYQASQVRQVLLEAKGKATDPAIRTEAQSLAKETESICFSICSVWYDFLNSIEKVSKLDAVCLCATGCGGEPAWKNKTFLTDDGDAGFASVQNRCVRK